MFETLLASGWVVSGDSCEFDQMVGLVQAHPDSALAGADQRDWEQWQQFVAHFKTLLQEAEEKVECRVEKHQNVKSKI